MPSSAVPPADDHLHGHHQSASNGKAYEAYPDVDDDEEYEEFEEEVEVEVEEELEEEVEDDNNVVKIYQQSKKFIGTGRVNQSLKIGLVLVVTCNWGAMLSLFDSKL